MERTRRRERKRLERVVSVEEQRVRDYVRYLRGSRSGYVIFSNGSTGLRRDDPMDERRCEHGQTPVACFCSYRSPAVDPEEKIQAELEEPLKCWAPGNSVNMGGHCWPGNWPLGGQPGYGDSCVCGKMGWVGMEVIR